MKKGEKKVTKVGLPPAPPFKKEAKPAAKKGTITQAPDKPRSTNRLSKAETAAIFKEKPTKAPPKKKKAPEVSEQQVAPTDIKRIVKLVDQLIEAQKKRAEAELALAECKKVEQGIEREMIPGLMDEIGVASLRLASGQTVSIAQDCEAKIPEAKKEKALAWLLKKGFGGLIKTDVSISFAKGDHDAAVKVQTTLTRMFPKNPTTLDETVHPQTLKSFVKERHAEGEPVPADLFGVFMFKKAVIKEN